MRFAPSDNENHAGAQEVQLCMLSSTDATAVPRSAGLDGGTSAFTVIQSHQALVSSLSAALQATAG
jgi:hypothetical protein